MAPLTEEQKERSVIVQNLPRVSFIDELMPFFEPYGVEDMKLIHARSNYNYGNAAVLVMASTDRVNEVITASPITIHGMSVTVHPFSTQLIVMITGKANVAKTDPAFRFRALDIPPGYRIDPCPFLRALQMYFSGFNLKDISLQKDENDYNGFVKSHTTKNREQFNNAKARAQKLEAGTEKLPTADLFLPSEASTSTS
uniref:uncharacterized protein LOC122607186 n=1 Tax=Erigeron canadensis TaxID=72917 RepID=UPI001CB8B310|nr:uncharacterized protein LOC122607186 [Erigeron canadensis]